MDLRGIMHAPEKKETWRNQKHFTNKEIVGDMYHVGAARVSRKGRLVILRADGRGTLLLMVPRGFLKE